MPVMIAAAAVELPLFGLLALGAWNRRRDLRVWVLSAGPVLYFSALHLVFASSMRYRIPGEMPALVLAAFGGMTLWAWWRKSPPGRCARIDRPASPGTTKPATAPDTEVPVTCAWPDAWRNSCSGS